MTAQAKESIKLLHFEHREWLNRFDFYKNEFSSYEKLLGEVAVKNNSHEVTPQIEHFQNQFVLQREKLDVLRHNVKQSENAIEERMKDNAVAWDHQSMPAEVELRGKVLAFDEMFNELKVEFRAFLQKVL
jgi:hypothetical protein